MKSFRNILFQVHLWTGLIVGIFFILLGLLGSALVYPGLFGPAETPTPKSTQQGPPMPLEQILDAARRKPSLRPRLMPGPPMFGSTAPPARVGGAFS
jgi:uncharacterized iron-regulated membrane protein